MKKDSTKPKDATNFKQTKLGIIPRKELIRLEIRGVGQGLRFIESAKNQKITPELILKIHKKSFGFIFSWAGKFRTIDVMIRGKKAPEHFKVPAMIREYCDDLEERFKNLPDRKSVELYFKELIPFLAWSQHKFVAIHPFCDYNGRTARLITNLLLLRLDLPLIEIKIDKEEDRKRYIGAMKKADDFNYSPLEEIIYDALKEALKKIFKVSMIRIRVYLSMICFYLCPPCVYLLVF